MNSTLEILGRQIPLYGLCWIAGIGVSALVAMLLISKTTLEKYDFVCASVFSLIGGLIGAKLLFIMVSLKSIIENNVPLEAVIRGGFVFYGGLLGGVAGLLIYTKMFNLKTLPFSDILSVVLPLGHAFGRVGCHFASCCYGKPYDGFMSVTYSETMGNTPLGVPLFPIQLLEAVLLILLFISLLTIYLKTENKGLITKVYLFVYAVLRFTLEFLRGDRERGVSLGISTSQIISLGIILAVIAGEIISRKRKSVENLS